MEQTATPPYGADQVFLDVKAWSIYGSDLHLYREGMRVEAWPEHEFAASMGAVLRFGPSRIVAPCGYS